MSLLSSISSSILSSPHSNFPRFLRLTVEVSDVGSLVAALAVLVVSWAVVASLCFYSSSPFGKKIYLIQLFYA
jgi:hypothetical protein